MLEKESTVMQKFFCCVVCLVVTAAACATTKGTEVKTPAVVASPSTSASQDQRKCPPCKRLAKDNPNLCLDTYPVPNCRGGPL